MIFISDRKEQIITIIVEILIDYVIAVYFCIYLFCQRRFWVWLEYWTSDCQKSTIHYGLRHPMMCGTIYNPCREDFQNTNSVVSREWNVTAW